MPSVKKCIGITKMALWQFKLTDGFSSFSEPYMLIFLICCGSKKLCHNILVNDMKWIKSRYKAISACDEIVTNRFICYKGVQWKEETDRRSIGAEHCYQVSDCSLWNWKMKAKYFLFRFYNNYCLCQGLVFSFYI